MLGALHEQLAALPLTRKEKQRTHAPITKSRFEKQKGVRGFGGEEEKRGGRRAGRREKARVAATRSPCVWGGGASSAARVRTRVAPRQCGGGTAAHRKTDRSERRLCSHPTMGEHCGAARQHTHTRTRWLACSKALTLPTNADIQYGDAETQRV